MVEVQEIALDKTRGLINSLNNLLSKDNSRFRFIDFVTSNGNESFPEGIYLSFMVKIVKIDTPKKDVQYVFRWDKLIPEDDWSNHRDLIMEYFDSFVHENLLEYILSMEDSEITSELNFYKGGEVVSTMFNSVSWNTMINSKYNDN